MDHQSPGPTGSSSRPTPDADTGTSPFYDPTTDYIELNQTASSDLPPPPYTTPSDTSNPGPNASTSSTPLTEDPDLKYGRIGTSHGGVDTDCRVAGDGRLNISISEKTPGSQISKLLVPALRSQLKLYQAGPSTPSLPKTVTETPRLRIVIQVIGSRGDVQPFLALAKVLQAAPYHHRVRLATHASFKKFVEDAGVEFFCIGGDPSELMAYMVKNPGLMPGVESLRDGEVSRRRRGMAEMLVGGWRSCIEAGDGMGGAGESFVADVILANPPSFSHVHCAERLGVPLHLMFTMPWSPTSAFPHPLANIYETNVEAGMVNFLSYLLVEMMTWQGLGDVVNKFRQRTLGLPPLSTIWAPGLVHRLRIPHTYCWSPALIPKPNDWADHIGISGFYFLSLASTYTPPPDLDAFLRAGDPPVYIGFGSIVVDDPNKLTQTIFEAVRLAGVRAIVSKGWGGIGGEGLQVPENIFLLDNCPHDWLFAHVSAVVHHGGAGTTAIGLAMGKPTVIVPFFGDQAFWGNMVHKRGLGPAPIHNKTLTAENLAEAITYALRPDVLEKSKEVGRLIMAEKGAEVGAKEFTDTLTQTDMRCDLAPERVAVWRHKKTGLKLSAAVAHVLVEAGHLTWEELRLHRHVEWQTDVGPTDPITGGASAILGTLTSVMMGAGDIPLQFFKGAGEVGHAAKGKKDGKEVKAGDRTSTDGSRPVSAGSEITVVERPRSAPGIAERDVPQPKTPKKEEERIGYKELTRGAEAVEQIVTAGIKSPRDFNLALARGFHNAPLLYGDTIRPPEHITGIQSGVRAAARGLGLGFWDGITGLVTQPLAGAKEGGAAGFMKGVGKGLGGIVLKPGAGIFGVSGYAMEGIYREVVKMRKSGIDSHLMAVHMADGLLQSEGLTDEDRREIMRAFVTKAAASRTRKEHSPLRSLTRSRSRSGERVVETQPAVVNPALLSPGSRPRTERTPSVLSSQSTGRRRLPPDVPGRTPSGSSIPQTSTPAIPTTLSNPTQPPAYEQDLTTSIDASVQQTSRGNTEEDEMIARAIRASLAELQLGNEEDAYRRAVEASVRETEGYWDEREVEAALGASLGVYGEGGQGGSGGGGGGTGGS
ncbi:UDP-Glycosyltransferase/glycogen phosphorylase [Ascobolus immersus RN42]|uniref:UDP-Glycosyltransferase/glycogen phosphorylase n=1 Tax=Ascobolus immersus RN42 TaxID=1160509 RepID=A0A3N4HLD3_ASCIM|nr:UDP-Glycosyltransferase/glycogen phosphorylase [Ascobolus immersus RN42]